MILLQFIRHGVEMWVGFMFLAAAIIWLNNRILETSMPQKKRMYADAKILGFETGSRIFRRRRLFSWLHALPIILIFRPQHVNIEFTGSTGEIHKCSPEARWGLHAILKVRRMDTVKIAYIETNPPKVIFADSKAMCRVWIRIAVNLAIVSAILAGIGYFIVTV